MGYRKIMTHAEYMKIWRDNNPEKYKLSQRRNRFKRKYGMTEEDYWDLCEEQKGLCAICGRSPKNTRYGLLHVDHCHATGIIRGLLCDHCNRALGILGDSQEAIRNVLAYLERAELRALRFHARPKQQNKVLEDIFAVGIGAGT